MSFPRYPKYKTTGVGWLGDVPEHWEVCALKRIVSLKSGDAITTESIQESGEFPVFGGNGMRGYTSRYTHDGNYAVVGRQGALCGNINYAHGRFWASEHAVVANPRKPASTIWLGEMLRTMNLNQHSVSAAQPGLSMEFVGNLQTVYPPITDQEAIAEFLNLEMTRIDELVAEQRRLIELLKEKRQAVISHAVINGLNSNAPKKPSGIDWLGEVPAHWGLVRLRRLFEIKKRIAGTLGYDVFSITQNGFRVRDTENFEGQLSMDYSKYQLVYPGDFAMNPMDLITGGADFAKSIGVTSPDYRVFSLREPEKHSRAYLLYIFNHCYRKAIFYPFGQGSSQLGRWRFPRQQFNDFFFPVPSKTEQLEIVEFLDGELKKFDALTAEAERAIELLQERRTALISAAVTGKIDVRETGKNVGRT